MTEPLVWLPFEPELLGDPPAGLRYEVVVPADGEVPASVAEVELYVPPYRFSQADVESFIAAFGPDLAEWARIVAVDGPRGADGGFFAVVAPVGDDWRVLGTAIGLEQ